MWIGSAKNNKTKPFSFESYHEPVKSLGVNLSYDRNKNNNLNLPIPRYLKKNAQGTAVTNRDILNERDVFYLSENKALYLTKLRCKDYYNLFQENNMKEPTAVKNWTRLFLNFAHSWKQIFNTIYQTTADNKIREFGFKFCHRILVTNRELKRFKIRNDDICA